QIIAAVDFKDVKPKLSTADEENLDGDTNADMANASANPDVEPEADANGRVAGQKKTVRPATVVAPPPRKPNFFERLFGIRQKPAPAPSPPPKRQPQGRNR